MHHLSKHKRAHIHVTISRMSLHGPCTNVPTVEFRRCFHTAMHARTMLPSLLLPALTSKR